MSLFTVVFKLYTGGDIILPVSNVYDRKVTKYDKKIQDVTKMPQYTPNEHKAILQQYYGVAYMKYTGRKWWTTDEMLLMLKKANTSYFFFLYFSLFFFSDIRSA